jgi:dTDP-4-amino-4,6-dideoxygalactose transaminase
MKRSVEDLAIAGAVPAFTELLHVGRPNLGSRDVILERINDILARRYLTNGGPYELAFERSLGELLGVRHCIVMCNATVALEIAIRAAGLSGEVIVPSFTFIATAHALQWQGVTPVFCDIDPATHNIDPAAIEPLISPRTSGIIGVHLWGRPAAVAELERLAASHGLKLIFDAAHALGCTADGVMIGGFGDAEVLSFHATKFVNTFEGGAIVTNDDRIAAVARRMRNFGFAGFDDVRSIGTNGKMNEVSAAMGLTSLEAMASFVELNRSNYHAYATRLGGLQGLRVLKYDERERCNYQYVVVQLDAAALLTRDELVRVLVAEGVVARRYFHPGCHRMEPYRSADPAVGVRLPHTEAVASSVLQLPTGTAVDEHDIDAISSIIRCALGNAERVRQRLGMDAWEGPYRDVIV